MLKVLSNIESTMNILLDNEKKWNSLNVTYEQPNVKRVWRQIGEYRAYLHKILPCKKGSVPFLHPHPWASAMVVLKGSYRMNLGHGIRINGEWNISKDATFIIPEGSRYEMTDPNGFHSIEPIENPVITLMITGKPWHPCAASTFPRSLDQSPLNHEDKQEIYDFFKSHYSRKQ